MTTENAAAAINPNAPQSITISQARPGLRVVLIGIEAGDQPTALRGKVIAVKAGWITVRFDDGVTRQARAKALALDTADVVEFVSRELVPPAVAQQPIGGKRASKQATKVRESVVRVAKATGGKVLAAGKPVKAPKAIKVGQPCLCACGELANPGRAFRQGHDARFHGWMKRLADERMRPAEVPAAALKLMNLNKDGVPTTDYDGSPWKP